MNKYKIVHGNNMHFLIEQVNKELENGYIPIGRAFQEEGWMNQTMIHESALKGLADYVSEGVLEKR